MPGCGSPRRRRSGRIRRWTAERQRADLPRHLEVLAGGHHERAVADHAVAGRDGVALGVDGDAEEPEVRHSAGPDRRGVLADASGEDERIEAAHGGSHRRDPGTQAVHVDVERELRVLIAPVGSRQ